jgi:hypothetical protein
MLRTPTQTQYNLTQMYAPPIIFRKEEVNISLTRPAWAGFKTAEEGKAIIKSYIISGV